MNQNEYLGLNLLIGNIVYYTLSVECTGKEH